MTTRIANKGKWIARGLTLTALILTVVATQNAGAAFVAYNDLLLQTGEPSTSITTNSPATVTSGQLVDFSSGSSVSASVSFSGAVPVVGIDSYSLPGGSDAYAVFNGKLDSQGYEYWSVGDVVMTLSGLDPSKRYTFVLYPTRGAESTSYSNRYTRMIISDASGFTNNSSAGSLKSTSTAANDTTMIVAGNMDGKVFRYDGINPGGDGDIAFTLTAVSTNGYGPNAYIRCYMLQESSGTDVSTSYEWRQTSSTYTETATARSFYLYISNSLGDVFVDDLYFCAGTVPESGANLMQNPGFENGLSSWSLTGGHTISSTSSAFTHNGASSLQLTCSAPTFGGGADSVNQVVSGMSIGQVYTLSFWYLATNAVDFVGRFSSMPASANTITLDGTGTRTGASGVGSFFISGASPMPVSNTMRIGWPSTAGKIYRVVKGTSLNNNAWQQWGLVTAATATASVDIPTSGKSGFFRLIETMISLPSINNAGGASAIGPTTATLNGTLDTTGSIPTSVYVCWDTSDKGEGTLNDWSHVDYLGIRTAGPFSDTVSGLSSNATYYYRCYAENMAGSRFASPAVSFSTVSLNSPTLSTPTASPVGSGSATLGATITSDGGSGITSRGTCYGSSPAPTLNALAEGGTGTGAFSHYRSGLSNGTFYYYRGYAVNAAGTGYSPDGSFWTEPLSPLSLSFSAVGSNSLSLSWSTNGTHAAGCIVLYRAGADLTGDPVDGTTYSAGNSLGGGTVGYVGTAQSVNLTGLTPGQTYYIRIYGYAGSGYAINYQQDNPATGNQATTTGGQTVGPNAFYLIQAYGTDDRVGTIAPAYVYVADPVPGNHTPNITSITATPSTVAPYGTVSLSATATDSDGDPLEYAWVVTGGELGWSRAANETWKAPSLGGTYKLEVMVGDGKTWTNAYVDVTVNGNGNNASANHPPAIYSMIPSKVAVSPGETISVTCTGGDRDGDPFNVYMWTSSINPTQNFGGYSTVVNWTAPSTPSNPASRVHHPGMVVWNQNRTLPAGCPFTLSTELVGIALMGRSSAAQFADTWQPSWASDGSMYSSWQDGGLTTEPVNQLGLSCWPPAASATSQKTGWAHIAGDDPQDLVLTEAGLLEADKTGWLGRYPNACVWKDGTFYMGSKLISVYNVNGQRVGDAEPWAYYGGCPNVGFHSSNNGGTNWTLSPHGPNDYLFGNRDPVGGPSNLNELTTFGTMYLVDYGRNQERSPDGKIYFATTGAKRQDHTLHANNGDVVHLCRVSASGINNGTAYEFYAGGNNWSTNMDQAQPILEWDHNIGGAYIVCNPGLNKYIMTAYKNGSSGGVTTPFEWLPDDTFIFESDSLTGPYRLVSYLPSFGNQAYFAHIPAKFISADGKTAWLWYSANFTDFSRIGDPLGSSYRMAQQQIRFLTPADLQ